MDASMSEGQEEKTTTSTKIAPLQLDESTDSLSTLSSSLSLLLQIASQSIYRLSASSHIQLHPSIPPHLHSNSAGDGLIPTETMREDIKELVDDFMDRAKSIKQDIEGLEKGKTDEEHTQTLVELNKDLDQANAAYEEALAEAEELQKELQALLLKSCS